MIPLSKTRLNWIHIALLTAQVFSLCTLHSEETGVDETEVEAVTDSVDPGHSFHGETFNEGPRQSAVVMQGLAKITFPTSAATPETQAFIEQGVAQLHGFWYLEAERSFRQAAFLQPGLGIAYWGCAMANHSNQKRATGFIEEAMKHCDSPTTRREKLYIESFDRYLKSREGKDGDKEDVKKEAKRKANERLIADLETIIDNFPEDIEARAFLALQLWLADGEGVKLSSRYAVDAILDGIFAKQPMHPAHHYRIHLWDNKRPKNALDSAAKSGPTMPSVAHMWHMPGHTYSKLYRYEDAVWQQEASARVDHAHMIESRLLPDQIHNFAHNNEWMVRNLIYLGRAEDAVRHSKNLINLPRHPKYNSFDKGSFRFGRERLLQALSSFGLWSRLIEEASGPYLADTKNEEANEERDSWLAVAHFLQKDTKAGSTILRSLQRKNLELQSKILDATEAKQSSDAVTAEAKQSSDAVTAEAKQASDAVTADDKKTPDVKALREHVKRLRPLISRVAAAAAANRHDKEALERHAKIAKLDPVIHAQWLALAGDLEGAEKIAEKAVKDGRGQVRPLAVLVDLLWRRDKQDEAAKRFEELRKLAFSADIETPLLKSLKPIADKAKIEGDWRIAKAPAKDLGERPEFRTLGPEKWQPPQALPFTATTTSGVPINNAQWDSKPRILIFYLGSGCLHCVEQLKAFSETLDQFKTAGIDVVAVSTDDAATLRKGIEAFAEPVPISLFAAPDFEPFKSYRCWDDFESVPLHGTFLIDAAGRVRWQDIGAEPFTDIEFLLDESKRLLSLAD